MFKWYKWYLLSIKCFMKVYCGTFRISVWKSGIEVEIEVRKYYCIYCIFNARHPNFLETLPDDKWTKIRAFIFAFSVQNILFPFSWMSFLRRSLFNVFEILKSCRCSLYNVWKSNLRQENSNILTSYFFAIII